MTLQEILALPVAEMGAHLRTREADALRFATPVNNEVTADNLQHATELDVECDQIRTAIDSKQRAMTDAENLRSKITSDTANRSQTVNTLPLNTNEGNGLNNIRIPVGMGKRYKKLEVLKDERQAFIWGQFTRMLGAPIQGKNQVFEESARWLRENGIMDTRALSSSDNSLGGVLVPDILSNDIINLKEEYGVFRPNAQVVPMPGGTLTFPRRKSGASVYWIGESSPTTSTNLGWDNVMLTPKKVSSLVVIPDELNQDSIINLGDYAVGEFAYAFALAEDTIGFTADGSSTYGGMTGLTNAINNVVSNKGIQVASGTGYGTDYSSITRANLSALKAKLPMYALMAPDCAWYMSSVVWASVVESLAIAAGGNAATYFIDGASPKLLGIPVKIAQALPMTSAINQICILLGSLKKGAMLGDRSGFAIKATKEGQYFDNDQTAYKAQERIDIVIHDPGTSTTAGPVVALKTAGS